VACNPGEKSSTSGGGTIVIATTASDPGPLFPPLVKSTIGREITELVYDYLTETSPSLNTIDDKAFAKRLADSWQWGTDSLSLSVRLRSDARWHDGQPVRSDDVAYTYSIYTDSTVGSSLTEQLASIDSVSTPDSLTVVFWFKKRYPLQFYDATSQMQIVPKHVFGKFPAKSLAEASSSVNPIGSGRYRFANSKQGETIELIADSAKYRGAPGIRRVIWRTFQTPDNAVRALFAGEVDIYDQMRPENVTEAASYPDIRIMESPGSDYAFMTFNLRRPIFESRSIRRAITMALDRQSMTTNVFSSLARAGIGPTVSYFPSTDSALEQIPYNPDEASRILDSLGWKRDPKTGMRSKNGKPLHFKITLPSTSANRIRMGVLIQEQLRQAGIAVDLDQMEFGTFNDRLSSRDFDAALASWHLGTDPASIRELWTSDAARPGGNNLGSYRSRTFDAYVDSAVSTFDVSEKKSYYSRAYQEAIGDAPAVWLYEPKLVIGIHKRIQTRPYRPDAWWWSLSDWSIPADQQIDRDRIK